MTGESRRVSADTRFAQIEKLNRSLTNITPSEEQIVCIEDIRLYGKALGETIIMRSEPSREQSLALTKLEEAIMWAVKGVILNHRPEDPAPETK